MVTGGPTPVAAASTWSNPVFAQVQDSGALNCAPTDADLVATCIAPDGIRMRVEAEVGPTAVKFTFTYKDKRGQQRNVLRVFTTPADMKRYLAETDQSIFDNRVVGDRWTVYGTDAARLATWADNLKSGNVVPTDVATAAYSMGLLPVAVDDSRRDPQPPDPQPHGELHAELGDAGHRGASEASEGDGTDIVGVILLPPPGTSPPSTESPVVTPPL